MQGCPAHSQSQVNLASLLRAVKINKKDFKNPGLIDLLHITRNPFQSIAFFFVIFQKMSDEPGLAAAAETSADQPRHKESVQDYACTAKTKYRNFETNIPRKGISGSRS